MTSFFVLPVFYCINSVCIAVQCVDFLILKRQDYGQAHVFPLHCFISIDFGTSRFSFFILHSKTRERGRLIEFQLERLEARKLMAIFKRPEGRI
ncbi:hypothetical protein UPYG_G00155520 [Umbra pygmaea]|uniref:Secreted protein n=1 Tax=Umbra pygmaea TaxID=75934 RepID=A0ABD0X291_UMBPY